MHSSKKCVSFLLMMWTQSNIIIDNVVLIAFKGNITTEHSCPPSIVKSNLLIKILDKHLKKTQNAELKIIDDNCTNYMHTFDMHK